MDDAAIAAAFDELADLLEVQGENPFKTRAYRGAAEAIRGLREPLRALRDRGALSAIPGFGDAIGAKIGEVLDTGRIDALERARAAVGVDVRTLRRIHGLGHKTIARLHAELGVRTLAELEAAVASGRIRRTAGLGAALEERLRAQILLVKDALAARRLDEAFELADRLVPHLPGCVIVGAARRFEPVVTALVVAAPQPVEACRRALEKIGATDIVVGDVAAEGRVDLFPVRVERCDPARQGRRVVELTGSEAHVKNLRSWAAGHGVSWKGLEGDEPSVYAALDLQTVPPELRDGTEEVELASAGALGGLLTPCDIRGDLQCHTTFSDGAAGIVEMARAAAALGYEYLGVTDHAGALPIAGAMDAKRIEEYVRAVGEANDGRPGVTVLAGAEVEVDREGALTVPDAALETLDYVLAGIHAGLDLSPERQTARYLRVIEHPLVRIVAHPMGRKVNARPGARLDFARVAQAAVDHGVALELDASPVRLDLDAAGARRVLGLGGVVSIASDAHHPDELGRLAFGVMTARKAYAKAERIVNAWPLGRVREFLAGR